MLLLYDIDGTLLRTDGAGRRAVHAALQELTGCVISTDGVSFSGKTDPQILREVLVASKADSIWLDGRFKECVDAYHRTAYQIIEDATTRALAGAREMVHATHQDPRFTIGLLTGNIRPMAFRKLEAVALDHFFEFGAFGCDSEDRNDLPAIAVDRAKRSFGKSFAPRDVVIIGDTPRDIACAHAYGARAIAVATGRFSRDDLAESEPDYVLDDLVQAMEVLETMSA